MFFLSLTSLAQERFIEPLFDEILKETYTYAKKEGEELDLDLYLPDFDSEEKRPLLVFVHGGGFSSGSRDRKSIVDFCEQFAQLGYAVASMSYRLTRKDKPGGFGCQCSANDKLNTFQCAIEDIQDAIYFLIENRHQFAIDPQTIILSGSSAGAEAVLNTAYKPPYCYGLDSGPVSYAGVIGIAGAIPDTTALYDESAVPSFFIHGTDDPLVPYSTAPHHYCEKEDAGYLLLHGSHTIAEKLDQLSVPYWLNTYCGAGHELASTPLMDYFMEIKEFCYTFIIQKEGEQRHTIKKGKQNKDQFETFNICSQ